MQNWPISNDTLTQDLLQSQQRMRHSYAQLSPLGLHPTGEELAAAANSWADEALRDRGFPAAALRGHLAAVRDFSNHRLPRAVTRLPVLYPFCGVDLMHALALFPHAPRYVMLAGLPLGDPICFVIPECRAHMTKMLIKFMAHWMWNGFAWTQTFKMNQVSVPATQILHELSTRLLLTRSRPTRRRRSTSSGGARATARSSRTRRSWRWA